MFGLRQALCHYREGSARPAEGASRGRKRTNPIAFSPANNPTVFSRGLKTLPAIRTRTPKRFAASAGILPSEDAPGFWDCLPASGQFKGSRKVPAARGSLFSIVGPRPATRPWVASAAEQGWYWDHGGLRTLDGTCPRVWPLCFRSLDGAGPVGRAQSGPTAPIPRWPRGSAAGSTLTVTQRG